MFRQTRATIVVSQAASDVVRPQMPLSWGVTALAANHNDMPNNSAIPSNARTRQRVEYVSADIVKNYPRSIATSTLTNPSQPPSPPSPPSTPPSPVSPSSRPAVATLSRDLADFLVELSITLNKHAIYPSSHPLLDVGNDVDPGDARYPLTRRLK